MIRGLSLAVVALAVMLPASQRRQPPTESGQGALGVLRRDGVLLPFAVFNGDSWEIAWPIALNTSEIPINLESVPKKWWGPRGVNGWRVRLGDGDERSLELQALAILRLFCSRRLGIRTDYRPALPLPPVHVEPFPKDGLAINANVPVEPIESVARDSPEWTALAATLAQEFDRVEEETIQRVRANTGWRHPLERAERRKLPVRLESWYRSPAGEPGWTVSYVEAVRQFPPAPEDKGCGLETLVSGWVHHENGVLAKASDLRGKITYCDRVGASYMLPFGRIRPRGRYYWIFQLSGWEDEWYDVAEVGPKRVRHVIEVYAGGRRSCQ
jgi:hypothetical protein